MMTTTDDLTHGYLRRLERELRDLPRERRNELLDEIREHIDEGMSGLASPTEADVRNLLERVGDPTEIAAEARERFGVHPPKRGALEVATLILLPVGGVFIPVLGWVVGVIFLWISEAWNLRDKLIGTLLLPGGLAFPAFLALSSTSSSACVSPSVGVPAGRPRPEPCRERLPGRRIGAAPVPGERWRHRADPDPDHDHHVSRPPAPRADRADRERLGRGNLGRVSYGTVVRAD